MYRSKKERDHYLLKFHGLSNREWKRDFEGPDYIIFRNNHSGKVISLRY